MVRPGGPVLIREGFTGRTDGIPWLRYFPEALAVTETFWPTVDAVVDAFAPAGFRLETLQPVEQVTARNMAAYADLVRVRADSTLIQLSEDDFAAGHEPAGRGGDRLPGGRAGHDHPGPARPALTEGPVTGRAAGAERLARRRGSGNQNRGESVTDGQRFLRVATGGRAVVR